MVMCLATDRGRVVRTSYRVHILDCTAVPAVITTYGVQDSSPLLTEVLVYLPIVADLVMVIFLCPARRIDSIVKWLPIQIALRLICWAPH